MLDPLDRQLKRLWKYRHIGEGPLNLIVQRSVENSQRWFPDMFSYQTPRMRLLHFVIGLGEEAGEVQGVVKKANRKGREIDREKLAHELADVLMYLFNIAAAADIDLARALAEKTEINDRRFG